MWRRRARPRGHRQGRRQELRPVQQRRRGRHDHHEHEEHHGKGYEEVRKLVCFDCADDVAGFVQFYQTKIADRDPLGQSTNDFGVKSSAFETELLYLFVGVFE